MATLEEVVYSRRNNPLTLSLFFKGKDRDVFTMLFGEKRWLENQWLNMSRATHFDFDRVLPMPYEIKERRERMLALLQGELDEQAVKEFWRLELEGKYPSATVWTVAKWGVADTRDVHVRFMTRKPEDGNEYLQLTFMGLINLPFALFAELDQIGIKYDAIWINDVEKSYGDHSSPDNNDSYYSDMHGRVYDLDQAYKLIYDVDVVDYVDAKPGLLWVRDLLVTADNALKDFLIQHPVNEWDDGNARIFFFADESRRDYCTIEKLLYAVISRNDFLREEIWEAELAANRVCSKLSAGDVKDIGFNYYNIRRLVDWGLDETAKQLAG